jgi:hypothetical protein
VRALTSRPSKATKPRLKTPWPPLMLWTEKATTRSQPFGQRRSRSISEPSSDQLSDAFALQVHTDPVSSGSTSISHNIVAPVESPTQHLAGVLLLRWRLPHPLFCPWTFLPSLTRLVLYAHQPPYDRRRHGRGALPRDQNRYPNPFQSKPNLHPRPQ